MCSIGYIYKIENQINGHVYIGQTKYNCKIRWSSHRNEYKRKSSHNYNTYLYNAMRKYGIDAFDFSVIESCPDDQLNDREKYWIEQYDSFNNGYNMTIGGEGGTVTKETEEQICKYWKDGLAIWQIQSKTELCYNTIQRILNENMDTYTKEEAHRRGFANKEPDDKRKVLQYSLSGDLLNEYDSIRSASEAIKTKESNIYAACSGKTMSSQGYIWRYKSQDKPDAYTYVHGESCKVPVIQYDLYGERLGTFDSVTEAANSVNGHAHNISRVCRTKNGSVCGYQWRYDWDDPPGKLDNQFIGYPVVQYDLDGNYVASYKSIKEASQITGVKHKLINSCCVGREKLAGNYQWRRDTDPAPGPYHRKTNAKPVSQYDLDGNLISTYESARKAAAVLDIQPTQITACCKGKYKTCRGFQWRYAS